MITSSNNSSHVLKKNVSDIFEQIKKKAEDLSTSEGSIPFFQNLSNPTNLTNPQIISLRKVGVAENSDDSKNKSNFIKTRNIRNVKKAKNEISELHDEFLISEQIKKLLLQKEPKIIFDKPKKRIYEDYTKSKTLEKDKKNKTIDANNNENLDLWSKLKKIKKIPNKEVKRLNRRKNISARDYISDTKDIQLMKYINKHKLERLKMLSNLKRTELEQINNTIVSLENNKDFINTNYNEEYSSYVNNLKRQKDEEEKNNFNLFLMAEKIKKEISQLQFRFNKKKKEKTFLINIVLLFIQFKEKMRELPEKAVSLFEFNNTNVNNVVGQRRLMKKPKTVLNKVNKIIFDEELNKILKYRGKPIYNDIFEFDYDYQQIEDKVRNKFKEKDRLEIEIEQMKEELKQVKAEGEYDPYADDKKELNLVLSKLKTQNEELKQEIVSLKAKFSDAKYNILTKKKHILKHSLSTISLKSTNNFSNNTNKNNSYFLNNINLYYDSYSTIYGFKNIYTLNNFNFNKMREVSDLYISCFKLYNTSKDNLFNEFEIYFEVEKNMKAPKINEDLVVIKMLEYIDQVTTLLILQKNHYLSKSNLRKKYEKLRNLLERDKRRMIFINNLKDEEERQKLKLQELELKRNKVPYIPTKKSEYKYYFKAQKDHLIKMKQLSQVKKPPTFEDFMYDIMV